MISKGTDNYLTFFLLDKIMFNKAVGIDYDWLVPNSAMFCYEIKYFSSKALNRLKFKANC